MGGKTRLMIGAIIALVAVFSYLQRAASIPSPAKSREPAMQFSRLDQDRDRDGRISKGEVKGDQDLAENWDRLDDNEEFKKFSRPISSP